MTTRQSGTSRRRARAEHALAGLGMHRSEAMVLQVQCSRAHHVAAVFETDAGLVVQSRTGPHGHGSKDFVDTGMHGADSGREHVDLLAAGEGTDERLPAWCDCGPRDLARDELLELVRAGEHHLRLT